jgi:hypothetical protein
VALREVHDGLLLLPRPHPTSSPTVTSFLGPDPRHTSRTQRSPGGGGGPGSASGGAEAAGRVARHQLELFTSAAPVVHLPRLVRRRPDGELGAPPPPACAVTTASTELRRTCRPPSPAATSFPESSSSSSSRAHAAREASDRTRQPTTAPRCARGSAPPLQVVPLCAKGLSAYFGVLQMGDGNLLETV